VRQSRDRSIARRHTPTVALVRRNSVRKISDRETSHHASCRPVSDPPEPIIASLLAEGANVADREAEVARMADAFRTPGSKLVVYGDRRLGKTSALERAAETARGVRAMVAVASFATASDASEAAQRILAAAQMPAHPRMGWGGSGSTLRPGSRRCSVCSRRSRTSRSHRVTRCAGIARSQEHGAEHHQHPSCRSSTGCVSRRGATRSTIHSFAGAYRCTAFLISGSPRRRSCCRRGKRGAPLSDGDAASAWLFVRPTARVALKEGGGPCEPLSDPEVPTRTIYLLESRRASSSLAMTGRRGVLPLSPFAHDVSMRRAA
jgi:hypothetical protein